MFYVKMSKHLLPFPDVKLVYDLFVYLELM